MAGWPPVRIQDTGLRDADRSGRTVLNSGLRWCLSWFVFMALTACAMHAEETLQPDTSSPTTNPGYVGAINEEGVLEANRVRIEGGTILLERDDAATPPAPTVAAHAQR